MFWCLYRGTTFDGNYHICTLIPWNQIIMLYLLQTEDLAKVSASEGGFQGELDKDAPVPRALVLLQYTVFWLPGLSSSTETKTTKPKP